MRLIRPTAALLLLQALLLACAAAAAQPLVVLGDRNLPPYEWLEEGQPRGANVDLLQAMGRVLGRPVEVRLLDWADAQAQVRERRADALTMLGRTPEREAQWRFTADTMAVNFALFVRADEAVTLGAAGVGARRIGVARGGLARSYVREAFPQATPVEVGSNYDGIQLLLRREIDALAGQEWSLYYLLNTLGATSIVGLPPFRQRFGNIAVRVDDAALQAELDRALAEVRRTGELERILDRWSSTRVRTVSEATIRAATWLAGVAVFALLTLTAAIVLLRRRRALLAAEIEERRRAEQVLQNNKRLLEEADRQKDRFLATLAHEIRNPLAVIGNAVAVLQRAPGDADKSRWAAQAVERQLVHLRRMVDDLLDTSRINAGQVALQLQAVPVQALVQEAAEGVRPLAAQRHQQLELECPAAAGGWLVQADRTRMQQVLSNLLTNAVRYTPEGGRIALRVAAGTGEVEIAVADNGMGMDPPTLANVFELFWREGRAAGAAPSGLGLGLWLCRRLVELHGGRIEARSAGLGAGSTFVVWLPLATARATAPAA